MRALACSSGSLRDKLVERLRQLLEVMQLARRHRRHLLAEAVDPDDGHAEGDRRSDVVEEARGDVDVSTRVGVAALRKNAPVRGRRPPSRRRRSR